MSNYHIIPLTRRQKAGSFFWGTISMLLGWSLYIYWWSQVLSEEQPREFVVLLLLIFLSSMILLALTLAWIWHNRRLARRGVRGSASRYVVPTFELDALGREISLPQYKVMRAATIVTIEATKETKTFKTEVRATS